MAGLQARAGGATIQPPLPQAAGYVVVVVLGLVVAVAMMYVTRLLKRTTGEDNKRTEMFMTANRTVRTGLTASAVISSWLWTTALLGSSFTGYDYGVAGPFWFAAGCSPMIVFFALLGISCKRKIPEAHTSLELVRIRYGRIAHVVFMILCLVNNIFASANMLLGAAAVIAAVSGMHIIAATFLVPVGVTVYTFVGGIKATFLTDYFHTVIILAIACYFTVQAFTNSDVDSVGKLYELVEAAGQLHPVSGNSQGSYLTMNSKSGILFGILHTCSNFGLVIMDTSYFIKSFSASPSAVVPGYTIGGILYFSIPWGLGTVMSSLAIGLENHPSFPTYPRRMTSSEVSGGLVLPYAAIAIAGKGGATAVLLMTFMAVTSTLSAQVIAVSSILSFDVYRQYFKKSASDRDLIRASHLGVIFFAAFAAGFSTMLHYVGIDVGWTLYMLGVVTCPGVFPMVFTVLWRHQNKAAAILAPVLGICTGIAVWLGTAYRFYGSVSVSATGELLPCVYGTVSSAFSPILYSVVISLFKPQNYDWSNFRAERLALEKVESDLTTVHDDGSIPPPEETPTAPPPEQQQQQQQAVEHNPEDGNTAGGQFASKELKRWTRIAAFWSAATFLGHWVIWPLPMYGSKYVFDKKFYYAWVVVGIIWLWITMLVATFYPVFDGGLQQIAQVWRGWKQTRGQGSGKKAEAGAPEGSGANSIEGASPQESDGTVDGLRIQSKGEK